MIQHSTKADGCVRNRSEMKIIEMGLLSGHLGGNTWGGGTGGFVVTTLGVGWSSWCLRRLVAINTGEE